MKLQVSVGVHCFGFLILGDIMTVNDLMDILNFISVYGEQIGHFSMDEEENIPKV